MKSSQKILQSTQLIFYREVAMPALTYAHENWIQNRPDKRKIISAELRFLCPVAV
jgi:hypothetical protein